MRRNDFRSMLTIRTLLAITALTGSAQLALAGGKGHGSSHHGGGGSHSGPSSSGSGWSSRIPQGSFGHPSRFQPGSMHGSKGMGTSLPWSPQGSSTRKSLPTQVQNFPGGHSFHDPLSHGPHHGNNGHHTPNVQGDFAKHHGSPLQHVAWKEIEHGLKHVNVQGTQNQIHQALRCAPPHVVRHSHCHWWFRYVCGSYACSNRPWICDGTYWNYWTPCRYYTVAYNHVTYYIGMECTLIPDLQGLGVQTIQGNSPAERAGLRPGDILLSVNGRPLLSGSVLNEELPTRSLTFEVMREGADAPVVITVIPRIVVSVGSY